jgi:hypothetical protein
MKNITVADDHAILDKSRNLASHQPATVNAMGRDCLVEVAGHDETKA